MRALLIEPHGTTRALLQSVLSESGCTAVEVTATFAAAQSALANQKPDLIVSTWSGPDGNALDLLETVRSFPDARAGTPFVVLTQERQMQVILSTADLGPDAVLLQPVSSWQLQKRVHSVTARYQALLPLWRLWGDPEIETAQNALQTILKAAPQFRNAALRLYGHLLERAGHWEAALAHYDAILAEHAKPWASLGKARTLLALDRLDEAQAVVTALTDAHPRFLDAWEVQALIAERLGDREAAAAAFQQIVTQAPINRVRLQHALPILLAAGDHETAWRALQRLQTHRIPRNAEDKMLIVEAMAETGRWDEAKALVAELGKWTKSPLEWAIFHFAQFRLAHRQGLAEEATDALRLALHYACDSAIPDPLPEWFSRLLLAGLSDETLRSDALRLLKRLRELLRDHTTRQHLAAQLRNAGYGQLWDDVERQLAESAKKLVLQGVSYAQTNDWPAAIQAMAKAVETLPGSPAVHFNLALAFLRARAHGVIPAEVAQEQAKCAARTLRRLDPKYPGLQKLETLLAPQQENP